MHWVTAAALAGFSLKAALKPIGAKV